MQKPKILLGINKIDDISKFPCDGYVLGYDKFTLFAPHYFSFEELKSIRNKGKIYILLNALIHEDKLPEFKSELTKLVELGFNFIVQDMGALSVILNLISSEKVIFNPYTLICNKNDFLAYQDIAPIGVGVSNQLTIEEQNKILEAGNGFLMIYGYEPIYQSYRKILSLYKNEKSLVTNNNQLYLREDTRDDLYPVIENEYGSVIFNHTKVNLLESLDKLNNAKYWYIDSFLSSEKEIDLVFKELKR